MSGCSPQEPWGPSPRGRRLALLFLAASLASTASVLQADDIYKSVDAQGNLVYSDHADPALPQASILQLADPRYPPRVMHFCWTNCFTLVLDGGLYRRADGTDETWTVETFSARSVVLHRHDAPAKWNGFSADVTYAGEVVGDRLVNLMLNGKPAGGIDASWGSALDRLPANNAERDARNAAQSNLQPPAPMVQPVNTSVSTAVAPPPVPDTLQPVGSEEGSLWIPGCWYFGDQGYYWVPGAWVRPPRTGLLWTPGYWSRAGTVYVFHAGYWSPQVGFYGGVNYGHGYFGVGYVGGRWEGGAFVYNRSVNRLDPATLRHTYTATDRAHAASLKALDRKP